MVLSRPPAGCVPVSHCGTPSSRLEVEWRLSPPLPQVGRNPSTSTHSVPTKVDGVQLEGQVFISHSSLDRSDVEKLKLWLQLLKIKSWVSFEDISNVDMRKDIEESLDSSAIFLLVWSVNSLGSREVGIEIDHAHRGRKPIISFQLDNCPAPKGVNMILQANQYVASTGSERERYSKLAILVLTAYGLCNMEASRITKEAWKQHIAAKRTKAIDHKSNMDIWGEKYWTRRWDSARDRAKNLSRIDFEYLADCAKELHLNEQDTTKMRREFNRDRRTLCQSIRSLLSLKHITTNDWQKLDQARRKCCISKNETLYLVARERGSANSIIDSTELPTSLAWLTECLNETSALPVTSIENITSKPSHSIPTPLQELEESKSSSSKSSVPSEYSKNFKQSPDPERNDHLDPSREKSDSSCLVDRARFKNLPLHFQSNDPALRSAAKLLLTPGMETESILVANQCLTRERCSDAYLIVGCAKYLLGFMLNAMTNIQTALSLDRDARDGQHRAIIINMLGVIHFSLFDYKSAHAEFSTAIKSDKLNPLYIFNRGLARIFLNRVDGIADLRNFAKTTNDNSCLSSLLDIHLLQKIVSGRVSSGDTLNKIKHSSPFLGIELGLFSDVRSNPSDNIDFIYSAEDGDRRLAENIQDSFSHGQDLSVYGSSNLRWNWPFVGLGSDSISYREIYFCQLMCVDLLQEINELAASALEKLSGLRKSDGFAFIHVLPNVDINTSARRAIRVHSLEGLMAGKLLVHFNESMFRCKQGILLFERGISLCSSFGSPHFHAFTPHLNPCTLSLEMSPGLGTLRATIGDSQNLTTQNPSKSVFVFSNPIIKGNHNFVSEVSNSYELLCKREAAWLKLRNIIRKEASFLWVSKAASQLLYFDPSTFGPSISSRLRELASKRSSLYSQEDIVLMLRMGSPDTSGIILLSRGGLHISSGIVFSFIDWNQLTSLEFIGEGAGGHFRVNGTKNIRWTMAHADLGISARAMPELLIEFIAFVLSIRERLLGL